MYPDEDALLRYASTVTAMIASASSTQTIAQTATKNHPSGTGLIPGKRLDAPDSFLAAATTVNIPQKCIEIGRFTQ